MIDQNTILPEKFLRMSEKELEKELLFKNRYTRKWVEMYGSIYQVVDKTCGRFILKQDESNYLVMVSTESFTYDYNDITIDSIKELKKNNSKNILKTWSQDRMENWLRKTALTYYKEEDVDVVYDDDNDLLNLIIHYPEFTVRNSIELEHKLRDVYMKYSFRKGDYGYYLYSIELARTTFEAREIFNNYVFSHCNNNPIKNYSDSFCYGSTDLSRFIGKCKQSDNHPYSYLQSLMLNFEEYLQWESIEGTPYKYIAYLNRYNQSNTSIVSMPYLPTTYKNQAIRLILGSGLVFNHEYKVTDKYEVKFSDSVINSIDELLTRELPLIDRSREYLFERKGNQSVKRNTSLLSSLNSYHNQTSNVVFKGERLKMTICDYDNFINREDVSEKKIHTLILSSIVTELQNHLQNYLITKKL